MLHFLYCTVNKLNGMIYVGKHSTRNLDDGYLGSGKLLIVAMNKHGRENFERHILAMCQSSDDALSLEAKIVDEELIDDENTYNLTLGGTGFSPETALRGTLASHKTNWSDPEFRKRNKAHASKTCKRLNPERNRRLHAEGRMKAPDWTGRKHREETKSVIGAASSVHQRGEGNSRFGSTWIHNLELQTSKSIPRDDLDVWLKLGWLKGRKMKW